MVPVFIICALTALFRWGCLLKAVTVISGRNSIVGVLRLRSIFQYLGHFQRRVGALERTVIFGLSWAVLDRSVRRVWLGCGFDRDCANTPDNKPFVAR